MTIHIMVPVWGEHHTGVFLEIGLPSQLAPGNVPALAAAEHCRYEIYTTAVDATRISKTEAFRSLQSFCEVVFCYLDFDGARSKWSLVRAAHARAIEAADIAGAVLFIAGPDVVWSSDCFRNAWRRLERGADCFLVPGLRSIYEDIKPRLVAAAKAKGYLEMPSRSLTQLALEHIHPEMEAWVWDDARFNSVGTYLMRRVRNEGYICFCYALHPVAIRPQVKGVRLRRIYDQDYIAEAIPDRSKLHICTDSDEAIFFELSRGDDNLPLGPPGEFKTRFMTFVTYLEWRMGPIAFDLAQCPIYVKSAFSDIGEWRRKRRAGRRMIAIIECLHDLPSWLVFFVLPQLYDARMRRLVRDEPEMIGPVARAAFVLHRALFWLPRRVMVLVNSCRVMLGRFYRRTMTRAGT